MSDAIAAPAPGDEERPPMTAGIFNRRLITGANPSEKYEGTANRWADAYAYGRDGKPWFTYFDIPLMERDSWVRFLADLWVSPFMQVTLQVKANKPAVQEYVQTWFQKFKTKSMPGLLRNYFYWGFAPGGVEWMRKASLTSRIPMWKLKRVRAIEPQDAQPLNYTGTKKFAGFRTGSTGNVLFPYAFWFAGNQKYGTYYDDPPVSGGYGDWMEFVGKGGARHLYQLGMRKHSISPAVLYFPGGTTPVKDSTGAVQNVDNITIALSTLETYEAGANIVLENRIHPVSKLREWELIPAESKLDAQTLSQYPEWLKKGMSAGVGIPIEVVQAAETGMGWSGRQVPLQAWYGKVDLLVGKIFDTADEQGCRQAVRENFGPQADYEVETNSLVADLRKQEDGGGQDSPGGVPKPKQPEAPTAVDPALVAGQGQSDQQKPAGWNGTFQMSQFAEGQHPRDKNGNFIDKQALSQARADSQSSSPQSRQMAATLRASVHPNDVAKFDAMMRPGPRPAQPKPAPPAGGPANRLAHLKGPIPANQADLLQHVDRQGFRNKLNDPMGSGEGIAQHVGTVPAPVARQFDAHGTDIKGLAHLLNNGVDSSRLFHTAPLAGDDAAGGLAAHGAALHPHTGKPFVLLGHPGKSIKAGGIGGVVVDGHHAPLIPHLQKAFPGVPFVPAHKMGEALARVAHGSTAAGVNYQMSTIADESHRVSAKDVAAALMLDLQHEANAEGDPERFTIFYEEIAGLADAGELDAILVFIEPIQMGWVAGVSPVKKTPVAIGTGSQQGKLLYGKAGAAALAAHARRETRTASRTRAQELTSKVMNGQHTKEDLHELATHLPALTRDRLRNARIKMGASFGKKYRHADMLAALKAHVQKLHAENNPAPAESEKPRTFAERFADAHAGTDHNALHDLIAEGLRGEHGDDVKEKVGGGFDAYIKAKGSLADKYNNIAAELAKGNATPEQREEAMAAGDKEARLAAVHADKPTGPDAHDAEREATEAAAKALDATRSKPEEPPVIQVKTRKAAATGDSLHRIVASYGGIDPKSHEFLKHYSGVNHAVEDGLPRTIFKTGGRGLDELAKELHTAGHIHVADGDDQAAHLMEKLAKGAKTLHADLSKQYDKALDDHYRLEDEARKAGLSESDIAEATRLGKEDADSQPQESLDAETWEEFDRHSHEDEGPEVERSHEWKVEHDPFYEHFTGRPAEAPKPHKFHSTHVTLPPAKAEEVKAAGRKLIPDDAIDPAAGGREENPHVTVRYGLRNDDDEAKVREKLKTVEPFTVHLGKTDAFPPSDSSDGAAPVYAGVEDKSGLSKLRAAIESVADVEPNTFGEYVPHVTLAYVKPDRAAAFKGSDELEGTRVPVDSITFSRRDGSTVEIPLGSQQQDIFGGRVKEPPKVGTGHKQITIEDAAREMQEQKAGEWAADNEKAIKKRGSPGRFQMDDGQWYQVGREADGYPLLKVNGPHDDAYTDPNLELPSTRPIPLTVAPPEEQTSPDHARIAEIEKKLADSNADRLGGAAGLDYGDEDRLNRELTELRKAAHAR